VYRFFQMRETDTGSTALRNWDIFISNVRKHSGRHVHQGGLVIFVLEGEGYSIVDGERVDWEAGDLILLPTKPDGVEHQHFNKDVDAGCKWIAFCYMPLLDEVGLYIQQKENAPDWKG
jgi:gentisate 1,2-dioxygenase